MKLEKAEFDFLNVLCREASSLPFTGYHTRQFQAKYKLPFSVIVGLRRALGEQLEQKDSPLTEGSVEDEYQAPWLSSKEVLGREDEFRQQYQIPRNLKDATYGESSFSCS